MRAYGRQKVLVQDGVGGRSTMLGSVTPVHDYEPGAWGPSEAEKFFIRPAEASNRNDGAGRSAVPAWA